MYTTSLDTLSLQISLGLDTKPLPSTKWLKNYHNYSELILSSMYGSWGVLQLQETFFQSLHISILCLKVKRMRFCFSSCVWIFLGDTVDWWVKDFRYIVTQSQTQLVSTVATDHHNYNGNYTRIMGRTASGGWENYCMMDEHRHTAAMFLKQLYNNGKIWLKFLLVTWEFHVLGYRIK
jgi:hypothetical protein